MVGEWLVVVENGGSTIRTWVEPSEIGCRGSMALDFEVGIIGIWMG